MIVRLGARVFGGVRGVSVVGVVWLLVVGAVAVLPGELVGAQPQWEPVRPGWVDELADREASPGEPPVAPPWVDSEDLPSAPPIESEGLPPLEFEFPEAGSWEVSLRGAGQRGMVVGGWTAGPVEVAAGTGGFDGERLGVEVLDRSAAERLGASAFVFEISELEGSGGADGVLSRAASDDGLPVELAVDYSGFEHAYGGGYADRLVLVALPDCVLEDPVPEGCDTVGQRLPTRVDMAAKELVVEVDDLAGLAVEGVESDLPALEDLGLSAEAAGLQEVSESDSSSGSDETDAGDEVEGVAEDSDGAGQVEDEGGLGEGSSEAEDVPELHGFAGSAAVQAGGSGGVVFRVMSSHSGETGSWMATPLSQSGSWQVSPGSGEFSWSYPKELL